MFASPGESATFEYDLIDCNGREHRFEAVATNLLDEPSMRGVVINSRDITDRYRLELELRDREQSFRMLFDDNPHPMWVFDDVTLRFLQVNDAACDQYGYSREELIDGGMTILDFRRFEDRTELAGIIEHRDPNVERPATVWRHQMRGGDILDIEVRAHATTFEGHKATLVLAQDVTERCRLEAELAHRAFYDSLTELPNRALFRDRVQHALDAAPRHGRDGEHVAPRPRRLQDRERHARARGRRRAARRRGTAIGSMRTLRRHDRAHGRRRVRGPAPEPAGRRAHRARRAAPRRAA